MSSDEHIPKIITDIRDVVSKLLQQFEELKEPITDDNNLLHRLCAKLEFVLTISLREKLLGQKRTYWQWFYSCLRKKTGLNDSLKFVQANPEVRSSKGRGRAFIRYCLVHQTLADSLQNCLMLNGEAGSRSALKPDSVLANRTHSSALIMCLYDLNAVNFDLNSKGYDLDAGWPTFASKRNPLSANEHWAVSSQMPLGSLPPPSVIMDSRMGFHQTSGSSGPPSAPSVDQRIEELVLELDQSDKRIKEQSKHIYELEGRNERLEKSTMEKEEILAGVISDLETKNRHLHDAMSHMSSEYQTRDEFLSKKLLEHERRTDELRAKNSQLEEDKYTLEQLVSTRMTDVTSNFTSSCEDLTASEKSPYFTHGYQSSLMQHNQEIDNLRSQLEKLKRYSHHMESLLSSRPEANDLVAELKRLMSNDDDEDEAAVSAILAKLDSEREEESRALGKIFEICGDRDAQGRPRSVDELVETVAGLKEVEERYLIKLQGEKKTRDDDDDDDDGEEGETENIVADRDYAMMETKGVRQQLSLAQTNLQDYKLQLEMQQSKHQRQVAELEEQLSICRQQNENLNFQRAEMMGDLRAAQEELKESRDKSFSPSTTHQPERSRGTEEQLIEENRRTIAGLQSELERHERCNWHLKQELAEACELAHKLKTDLEISDSLVESYTSSIQEAERRLSESESKLDEARSDVGAREEQNRAQKIQMENLHKEKEDQRRVREDLVKTIVTMCEDFSDLNKSMGRDARLVKLEATPFELQNNEIVEKVSSNFVRILQLHSFLQSDYISSAEELESTRRQLELTAKLSSQAHSHLKQEMRLVKQTSGNGDDDDDDDDDLSETAVKLTRVYGDVIERRNGDIEQLKRKILELLQDKDKFFVDNHHLRARLDVEKCKLCGRPLTEQNESEGVCGECGTPQDSTLSTSIIGGFTHLISSIAPAAAPNGSTQLELEEDEERVVIEAGKTFQLPVLIEQSGQLLKWNIQASLDLDFSLIYAQTEDEEEEEEVVMEKRRIQCHVTPYADEFLAAKVGVYTIVLDNSYSKFTSKEVKYKLEVVV